MVVDGTCPDINKKLRLIEATAPSLSSEAKPCNVKQEYKKKTNAIGNKKGMDNGKYIQNKIVKISISECSRPSKIER